MLEKYIFWRSSLLVFDVSPLYIENAFLEKETGFQDIGLDYVVELLGCHSVPFTKEELTEMDKQTYKKKADDNDK
jgi:hypothetical protein